ncbi:MAG: TonB-dependent receptor [Chitinophagaceae bacterium]|nr:MAG: TonB-dependent receptor [Chitinophagaceae bacterium]
MNKFFHLVIRYMGRMIALIVMLISLSTLQSSGQTHPVIGAVKSTSGTPLPGVTVRVKNHPRIGAVTNSKGIYNINVPSGGDTLIFSFIGYRREIKPIDDRDIVNAVMHEESSYMNTVIVTGYTQTLRKDLTGSVSTVNMKDMQKAPVGSFLEALGGRVAGVQVTSESGQPGAPVDILIRGAGSITQSTSPLYVIDGFPIESPDNNILDPQNIKSITVLKDASATALYGAEGSNGVIVITTKTGTAGPARISYSDYFGVNQVEKYMKLLSPYEYVRLQSDLYGAANPFLANGKTLEDYRNVKGIDWQKELFRNALTQNHSLMISGGNNGTRYSLSGNYFNQNGIMVASSFRRYQLKISLDQDIGKKARVGTLIMYTNNLLKGSSPQSIGSNPLFYSIFSYPPISYNVSQDSLLALDMVPDGVDPGSEINYRFNPISNLENLVRNNITDNLIANLYIDYNITKHLKLTLRGSMNDRFVRVEQFNNSHTYYGSPYQANGINGAVYNYRYNYFDNANLLTYTNSFNGKNFLTATLVAEFQKNTSNGFGYSGINLPSDAIGVGGIDAGQVYMPPYASVSYSTMASGIASVNYNYAGRYYLTANVRADGSSKFVGKNRWGYFPSGALKWKFTSEPLFPKNNVLTDGNIRFSYGETGNNRVGDFATYSSIYFSSPLLTNGSLQPPSAIIGSLPNPDLKWETTKQTDLGFDMGFWKGKVHLTVDLYNRRTDNLLYQAPLPPNTGFTSVTENIASLSNKGLEIAVQANLVEHPHFTYSMSVNASFNRNRLNSLADPTQDAILTNVGWQSYFSGTPAFIAQVGGPLGQMYGFVSDGVYQPSDFDQLPNGTYVLKPGVPQYTSQISGEKPQPGSSKFVDINHDGKLDNLDRVVIGNGYPRSTGGWSNDFTWKNFDLNIFFEYSYGNSIINANRIWFGQGLGIEKYAVIPYQEVFAENADRWSPSNQNTTIPNIRLPNDPTGPGAASVYQSKFVEDGSYVRLKTINLGYTFPDKLLSRLKVTTLRIYVSAQNLLTLTKYSGYDPEVSAYQSVLTPGVDFSSYPRPFVVTGGLNLSF